MHEQLTEWWNGISLRGKITGVTVLLLTLGLLVAGVGTMSFLRSYLLNQVYTTEVNAYAANPTEAVGHRLLARHGQSAAALLLRRHQLDRGDHLRQRAG